MTSRSHPLCSQANVCVWWTVAQGSREQHAQFCPSLLSSTARKAFTVSSMREVYAPGCLIGPQNSTYGAQECGRQTSVSPCSARVHSASDGYGSGVEGRYSTSSCTGEMKLAAVVSHILEIVVFSWDVRIGKKW